MKIHSIPRNWKFIPESQIIRNDIKIQLLNHPDVQWDPVMYGVWIRPYSQLHSTLILMGIWDNNEFSYHNWQNHD